MYSIIILLISLVACSNALKDTQDCAGYDCLKNYIDRPEPLYQWTDLGHRIEVPDLNGEGGWTGYVLNMTSQQWMTPELGETRFLLQDSSRAFVFSQQICVVAHHVGDCPPQH